MAIEIVRPGIEGEDGRRRMWDDRLGKVIDVTDVYLVRDLDKICKECGKVPYAVGWDESDAQRVFEEFLERGCDHGVRKCGTTEDIEQEFRKSVVD